MKRMARSSMAAAVTAALPAFAALTAWSAPVAPDPASLLRTKRVLVVEAANWNGDSHRVPKKNALALLESIDAEVGLAGFAVAEDVESYTARDLAPYDIIVFNFVFNSQFAVGKPFEAAFKAWLAAGKRGWMGYHTSGANEEGEWPWYRDSVTVMRYHVHTAAAQSGRMTITADPAIRALPILKGMDTAFTGVDEWYDFDLPPRAPAPPLWADCKVLYYLDETSLAIRPTRPMNPHPTAWIREDARGNRFFFSTFIHSDQGASSDFFRGTLLRGLEYLAGYDSASTLLSMGRSIRTAPDPVSIAAGRELRVEGAGPHRVEILSARGRTLERLEGEGPRAYRPAALSRAGVYWLRYRGRGGGYARRILVY